MKRLLFVLACSFALAKAVNADTVSLNINAGILENTLGTTPEPVGGLVELLASPSGTFGAPTSSSYTSGDDVLVASFAMTAYNNTPGLFVTALNGLAITGAGSTVVAGESLILRFYPSLTYAGMPSAPTFGTTYGQVRSSTGEFGTVADPSETGWFVPASGATVDLNYLTASAGGTYANTTAYATGLVITGVPEPSTYAMFVCGFAGLIGWGLSTRRNRRARLVS